MTQTIHTAADDTLSPVRALRSLTSAQAGQIVAGLSSLAGSWDIARHEGCDGQLCLLLGHTGHDTTLVVDRDQKGIHVSLMLGDQVYPSEHRYGTISDTVAAIRAMAVSPTLEHRRHSA